MTYTRRLFPKLTTVSATLLPSGPSACSNSPEISRPTAPPAWPRSSTAPTPAANVAVDYAWFGADERARALCDRLQAFFAGKPDYANQYTPDRGGFQV